MSHDTTSAPSTWRTTDPGIVDRLLRGAIDLHCHSGPSVMPRYFDHYEAMQEASAAGIRALLVKDHYYSAAPVTAILNKHFAHLNVHMFSGVPLNSQSGGLNVFAVEHGLKLGARLVWMPTFASANHISHHKQDEHFTEKFPQTKKKMLDPIPLTILDGAGRLVPEVLPILDLIAEHDAVLSSGHLHVSEIFPLFEEAARRGVARRLCNHPTYVVDATLDDIRRLVGMGVYIEHSMCMFVEGSSFKFWDPITLQALITAGTVERTILGSDLGQAGNPRVVDGFRAVIELCLDLGYDEAQVRRLVGGNAAELIGL